MGRRTKLPADGDPPNLWKEIHRWIYRKLGRKAVFALTLLCAAYGAWWAWPEFRDRWPVSWVVEQFSRDEIPKADSRRFSIAVARLENDSKREHEELIVKVLEEFPGIQVLRVDRSISAYHRVPEDGRRRGHAKAREYLRKSGASVLIWGSVQSLGAQSKPKLYYTTATDTPQDPHQYTPVIAQEFSLPVAFWGDLSEVLRLLVVSQWTQFQRASGQPVARELAEYVDRVRNLLDAHGPDWTAQTRQSTRLILAYALWRLSGERNERPLLAEAVERFEQALAEASAAGDGRARAGILLSLGSAYTDLGAYDQAVAAAGEASAFFDRTGDRAGSASGQHVLGNAELAIGERMDESGKAPIERAIRAHVRALQFYDEIHYPQDWASLQNDLGLALRARGLRSDDAGKRLDLRRATYRYELALRVHRCETQPWHWAASQVNLGISLLEAGEVSNDGGRVERSLVAFAQALRIYTREDYPGLWAETFNSVGNAAAALGELRSDADLLDRSELIFRRAQEVRTRASQPLDWATTENNRGRTLELLAGLRRDRTLLLRAERAFNDAERTYRDGGSDFGGDIAANNLRRVRGKLAAWPS